MSAITTTVDVRGIAPRDRHPLISSTFHALLHRAALEIVNDHDSPSDTWRMQITKRAAAGSCCGGCCQ